MKTLLIIPCYNEEENIFKVYEDIKPILSFCDYVFVNDCSTDQTARILRENHFNHIDLIVNLGLSGAVQAGYKYAYKNGYDAAIQFDGDGQHQAIYIKQMMNEIQAGNDIVIGSRFVNEKKSWNARMIGSRLIALLMFIKTTKKITDPTSGMRMLNRKMIRDYAYNMNRNSEPDTLCYQLKRGAKIKEIQVTMNEREAGESYLNTWSSVKYMIRICVSILFFY